MIYLNEGHAVADHPDLEVAEAGDYNEDDMVKCRNRATGEIAWATARYIDATLRTSWLCGALRPWPIPA